MLDGRRHRTIYGDDWLVRLYLIVGAIRYCRADKTLSLLTEIADETERLGRTWLFFRNTQFIVYMPESPSWDDGSPLVDLSRCTLIQDIRAAFDKAGEQCRIEISDVVYRQAEQDWATFGPHGVQPPYLQDSNTSGPGVSPHGSACIRNPREHLSARFPTGFSIQGIASSEARSISNLAPADIAEYLGDHPEVAEALLHESYDKRFTPSSFITEVSEGFQVGWLTSSGESECVKRFKNVADAATDYLMFSLGKGRWAPPHGTDPSRRSGLTAENE